MPKVGRILYYLIPLIVSLLLSQAACDRVNVQPADDALPSDPKPPSAVALATAETHDLAISAIDFNPALKSGSFSATDDITLLVAVENRGNQVEQNAVVEATLFGLPDSDVLVRSQGTIKQIAPGESQVVRFGNFSSIPLRAGYFLKVEIQPVAGEAALFNNTRTYKLEITVASK